MQKLFSRILFQNWQKYNMNFYFLCVTQPYNAGDLLINRMLLEELGKYGKVFVDCYNCPEDFRSFLIGNTDNIVDVYKTYGITLKKGCLISFAKLVKKENIQLYTQSPGPINKISDIKLRFSFSLIYKILSFLRIPIVCIGNCCSSAIVTRTNVVSKSVASYYVRSEKAVSFLKQCGAENVHYIPDLAYLYHSRIVETEKKKIAAFSFREVKENLNLFIEWIRDVIFFLIRNDYKIVFYHQVKTDKCFMRTLYDAIGIKEIELISEVIWYDTFGFYTDKSIIISNRLHCLLLGAVYNAVPLAYIDNDRLTRKITDVFDSSMGEYSERFITSSISIEKLSNIVNDYYKYNQIIKGIVSTNYKLCSANINKIISKYCKID